MGFLPSTYAPPTSTGGGNFFKPVEGRNKIRILSNMQSELEFLTGWSYWDKTDKPHRSPEDPGEPSDMRLNKFSGKPDKSFFWAMIIWDYATQEVKIWDCSQKTIQKDLFFIINGYDPSLSEEEIAQLDEDEIEAWGDPREYDLIVNKTKAANGSIEYKTTTATSKKPITAEVKQAYEDAAINLKALMTGGSPFGAASPSTPQKENKPSKEHPLIAQLRLKLADATDQDEIDAAAKWISKRLPTLIEEAGDEAEEIVQKMITDAELPF